MSAWWVPPTLRGYRPSRLGADALGGLTLVAVALPSQMATARLANLPVVTGLYAFLAGSVLFALIGTHRHLSVGADSTIAPVLAVGVGSVAAVGTAAYGTVMAFTALLIGAILVAVGLLRLGWIAEFLSIPVTTGILAGIAVEVAARQLPVVLGLPAAGTTTIGRLQQTIDHFAHFNGWSLAVAFGVLGVIVVARRIDRRVPGALIGLVASIVVSHLLHLGSQHGVAVLGTVRGGLPRFVLPSASGTQVRQLAGPMLTVAFVCIAQTAATVRASSSEPDDDFNRDLIGVGVGSIAAGFVGSFAVDASPPNTTIAEAAGARSQLANITAAVVIVVVLVAATAPLAQLPQATLGATLLFVASQLFRGDELRKILRFDRVEFALAAVTLGVVALVGIEQGVALALILSLADRTRRSARPRDTLLGREVGSDHWIPIDVGRPAQLVPGVLVYLVYAPVWYGDADYLVLRIRHLVETADTPIRVAVLDADGISDIDYTGLQALRQLITDLRQRGINLGVARASHHVDRQLRQAGLIAQLGADHSFSSVEEAVASLDRPSERSAPPTP